MKSIIQKHNRLSVELLEVICFTVNKAILEKDYNLMSELRESLGLGGGTMSNIKLNLGTPYNEIESFMKGTIPELRKVPCTPSDYFYKTNLLFKETNNFNLLHCDIKGVWSISKVTRGMDKPEDLKLLVDSYMYYGDGKGFDCNNRSVPFSEVLKLSFEYEWASVPIQNKQNTLTP